MSVLEKDDLGKPVMAAGVIESIDKDIRQKEMIYALGSNFNSIYYIDVDNDKVYVYTVNSAVESMIGEKLRSIPGYEDLMADYVKKTVIADDRETMLYETSLDNLRRQFQNKNAYQYDYRIFRDGKIKHCRAKFVNVSKKRLSSCNDSRIFRCQLRKRAGTRKNGICRPGHGRAKL